MCFNVILNWEKGNFSLDLFPALMVEAALHAHKRNCNSNEN